MLKIDIGTLAFSAAIVSLASALFISSHGTRHDNRGRSWVFAVAAGCSGLGQLIALMGSQNHSPVETIVGNILFLHSAIGFHIAICLLSGRRVRIANYAPLIAGFLVCYLSFFHFNYSLNVRIACAAALRLPIYAHAAWIVHANRRTRESRGLLGLEAISVSCGIMLSVRILTAVFLNRWNVNLATVVGWQSSYYLLWGLANVGIAVALVYLDAEEISERLKQTVVEKSGKLRSRETELRLIFDTSSAAIFFVNMEGRITQANRCMGEMFGRTQQSLIGCGYIDLVHPTDHEVSREAMQALMLGKTECVSFERRYVRHDGAEFWGHLSGRPMVDEGEGPLGLVGVIVDITERRRSEAHIEFLAHHDLLTGLPNRLLVEDRLHQSIAHAIRSQTKTALLFIDLDHFKSVNDSLGHAAGDSVLQEVANRLLLSVRDTDSISRHGGDEFLVVLSDARDSQAITAVGEKILEGLTQPVIIDGHEICISSSIGISVGPDDGVTFEELLKKADTAMYHAKESGRNTCRFYSEQMNIETTFQLEMKAGLTHALERDEFVLHYQPLIDLNDGTMTGVEALIRWNRPGYGLVAPNDFIPVAELSGLIVPIGDWVLMEACRQARSWQLSGFPELTVTVNLSAVQFKRGNLENAVRDALDASGMSPDRLELELTESILIENSETVLTTIDKLRAQGVRFAIDDFGTGYASLAYLKRFHVDKLKIDQSFVRNMHADSSDAAIVQAIIQLARSLQLQTVAEGVEDDRHLSFLKLQNCTLAQGFLFARPLPPGELINFAREHRPTCV
ncbi:EAL domain-containing protein [Telmatospirillum sp.]|uniref:putative bifunctional diguanylate cyclase/phosphodiesterase n=1 Tax=Telmatospirillum sp. TaxID=2079197 RepID=UPI00284E9355|nr:EAL domain-containing protein [Telmatospirillum sp.]MDR3435486.1 EAL domain-containing protein [Telmatospirillum sp.]